MVCVGLVCLGVLLYWVHVFHGERKERHEKKLLEHKEEEEEQEKIRLGQLNNRSMVKIQDLANHTFVHTELGTVDHRLLSFPSLKRN